MDEYTKSHGLGNDYLVMEGAKLSFSLTERAIRLICHRNFGVGSDGILLLVPTTRADYGLRIFNPDGSEAEKSGNGLRIFAKFLGEHGQATRDRFRIDTKGGIVTAELIRRGSRVESVKVDMGQATFLSDEIPVAGPRREVVREEICAGGERLEYTAVSVGNPHCVVLVDELRQDDLLRLGPLLERHASFPNRINVQLARVESRDRVSILIWERGAGYTLASGSSSCAVAAACVKNGLLDGHVTVKSPGGELSIDVAPDWSIRLQGPVVETCTGTLSAELLEQIRSGYLPPGLA
jgi:diaminopimelate epimerase